MTDVHGFLAHHYLFTHLEAQALDDVAAGASLRRLARGEILGIEGDPCEAVYLVMDGRVRALKLSPQGREQVVNEMHAGDEFYAVPALDGGRLPVTTQAATRAVLVFWPAEVFRNLLAAHPALERGLLQTFAGRLRRLSDLVGELSLYTVPERLARLLLEVAGAPPERRLTQQEMAVRLGTVREVVARTLADFQSKGWLTLDQGRIAIRDADALRDLAFR